MWLPSCFHRVMGIFAFPQSMTVNSAAGAAGVPLFGSLRITLIFEVNKLKFSLPLSLNVLADRSTGFGIVDMGIPQLA